MLIIQGIRILGMSCGYIKAWGKVHILVFEYVIMEVGGELIFRHFGSCNFASLGCTICKEADSFHGKQ